MRRLAVFAAVLILIGVRCVPGQLGVVSVGALLPPMPLKTTPTESSSGPSDTKTPPPTPTTTPTPTPAAPASDGPEFLPPEPDPR